MFDKESLFSPGKKKKSFDSAQTSLKLHIFRINDAFLNKRNPPNPPCLPHLEDVLTRQRWLLILDHIRVTAGLPGHLSAEVHHSG